MAEFDPRSAVKSPGFNTWGYAGLPKENDVYDFLDSVKASTDAVFETVNLVFALVNSALDFIASLLIDFTNPLKPIIEEIISILEAFIQDFRNTGLYITYDKEEFKKPLDKLLGGFPSFEQRIIKKLLNNKDKTRPNFTENSKVFAMTFFAGADVGQIQKIINLIKRLIKFFTSGTDEPASAPINVTASLYNDWIGEIELPNAYTPDGVRIKWKMPSPKSTIPAFPSSFVLPDYFVFSVSTRNKRDTVGVLSTVSRTPTDPKIKSGGGTKTNLTTINDSLADARLFPLFDTTTTIKLDEGQTYKPLDITPDGLSLNKDGWVLYNRDEVYLNNINGEKISEIYRTFISESGGSAIFGDNDFSFDLPFEALKTNGQLASEYYITMYSMEVDSETYNSFTTVSGEHSEVKVSNIITKSFSDGKYTLSSGATFSKASSTIEVKSPSDLRSKYLESVRFFFLAYALARLDYPTSKSLLGIEISREEQKVIDEITNRNDYLATTQDTLSRQKYAKEVLDWVDLAMVKFKFSTPSDNQISAYRENIEKIISFKYDLYEILTSSANNKSLTEGVFRNSAQWYMANKKSFTISDFTNYQAPPDSNVQNTFFIERRIIGASPVLYISSGEQQYYGNLHFLKGFGEVVTLAKPLVALKPSEATGQWIDLKPFRDTDLTAFIDLMNTIKKFLEGFIKGLEGIVAQILKYIQILKTRIAQIQTIIQKIKSIIDIILSLRIPAGLYGTFHLTDGTSGLINALSQSKDKPDIGSDGYGTGMMVVMGGVVPSVIIDLFIALMGGEK